jgi:hypothetical protein
MPRETEEDADVTDIGTAEELVNHVKIEYCPS